MQTLNISVVQTDLFWEDIDTNLSNIGSMIENISGCDLFILPEMFTTGFSMRPELFAADSGEKAQFWMHEMSKKLNAAVCGSVMTREADKFYNTFYFVEPDGKVQLYNKRHLFSPGDESKHYSKGEQRLIVNYKGWRICPQICYDLRFPVFSRNNVAYDMLIYVANWPSKRNYAWQQLLKARAIENQCYVIACNRIGSDGSGMEYIGNSCIVNYMGEEIGFGQDKKVYRFNIHKEPLDKFRQEFPVLDDMDTFTLI